MSEIKAKPRARKVVTVAEEPVVEEAPQLIVIGDSVDEEIETEPIFKLDGTTYTIPKVIPSGYVLGVMKDYRKHGEFMAGLALLEKMIGEDAFEVLTNDRRVTDDQLRLILDRVMERALGTLEKKRGNG